MADVKTTSKALTERMREAQKYFDTATELRVSSEYLLDTLQELESTNYNKNSMQCVAWSECEDECYPSNFCLVGKDEIDSFKQFLIDLLEMKNKKMQDVLQRVEVTQND